MIGKIKVVIPDNLKSQIHKTFKRESLKIYKKLFSLEDNPNKGKFIARIGTLLLKEIKYKTFRFYFFLDGNKLYLYNKEELEELLIKYLTMSKKNDQEKTIKEIKEILKILK